MAVVETTRSIRGGVDTHLDSHVVAALDPNGGVVGVAAFPATRSGYCSLSSWLGEFGTIGRVGVEGPVPMAPGLLAVCAASVSR
jgi:transposase